MVAAPPPDPMDYISIAPLRSGVGPFEPVRDPGAVLAARKALVMMHGDIGLLPNGERAWTPNEYPAEPAPIATLLREGGGFNLLLSDSIDLDRDASDNRPNQCRDKRYDYNELPSACIIIVFYNEPFSTLMRSVHSVLNRTPSSILHQIILVDDGSDIDWISRDGSNYIEEYIHYIPKTRLVRNDKRKGIVGARMTGIRACEAPIFVILDSHIEANEGWLEPLVERIKDNPTHILMPSVDSINARTLVHQTGGIGCILGFLWKLIEHAYPLDDTSPDERRLAGDADTVTSPTMAGGLFAANTDFFFDVGAYDEYFEYWGTENVELSFRLWMCGGVLECAPCSRVRHIFRDGGSGYSSPVDSVTKNKMRTLTIWMDEFADLAWQTIGKPRVDFGEYETMKKWRTDRQCHSFKWYLENVNPESYVRELPNDVPYLGLVKNRATNRCFDNMGSDYPGNNVKAMHCHGGSTQIFNIFSRVGHIHPLHNDESCMGPDFKTEWCHRYHNEWTYDNTTGLIRKGLNPDAPGALCIQVNDKTGELALNDCDDNDDTMKWDWTPYNPPRVFTPPPLSPPQRLRGN
eukprot:GHVO01065546.1.p1 GENE.GHVO01065546.1~~GHVO01065546.1.p1  ORF type:complete len:636 (+),score=78.71 GHVO01065546.1:182-1909(+)